MASVVLPPYSSVASSGAVASAAAPLKRSVEPVGRAYQATKHAAPPAPVADEADSADGASSGLNLSDPKYDRYKRFDIELDDYYTLLGLEERMFDATKEEITEAYRTLCKVAHPDKALPEDREKAEARYKAMQVGFETLTDAARRRGYDSAREFDDAIPGAKEGSTEKTFYSVYGPVFDRNARFSVVRPVPRLGDASTSDEDVLAFYDFWNAFQSWREFPELNANTLESASCRQQKREYERENAKKQAGRKREELQRVRNLTEAAYKKDPRVARIRAKQDEAKNAAKRKKEEEAKQKEADAKQRAIDEANRAAREKEAKAREAEEKKVFKEVQKKTRQAFGKACKAAGIADEQTDVLRATLEVEQMQEVVDALSKAETKQHGVEMFNAYMERHTAQEAEKKSMSAESKAAAKKLEDAREEAASRPWSHDEVAQLQRAVGKYPPGTMLRWEKITDMVNAVTSRGLKDVIKTAKLHESGLLGKTHIGDGEAFALYSQNMAKKTGSAATGSAAAASSVPTTPELGAQSAPGPHIPFSVSEQTAFEAALKSVPKDAADRWDQIAAKVGSKTKQQCMARYKEIRDELKKAQK